MKTNKKAAPKKAVKKDSATKLPKHWRQKDADTKARPKRKTVPADSIVIKPEEEEQFIENYLVKNNLRVVRLDQCQGAAPVTIEGQIKKILDALNNLNGKAQNETLAKVLKTVKDQRNKEIESLNTNLITATKHLQDRQENDMVFDSILKGQYEKLHFLD